MGSEAGGARGDSSETGKKAQGLVRKIPWNSILSFVLGAVVGGLLIAIQASAQKQGAPSGSFQKRVVAEEITLVDSNGKARAKITPSPGEEGVSLALYHRDGRYATLYRLNPTGLPTMTLVPLQ
jgi:hypothetical protein